MYFKPYFFCKNRVSDCFRTCLNFILRLRLDVSFFYREMFKTLFFIEKLLLFVLYACIRRRTLETKTLLF